MNEREYLIILYGYYQELFNEKQQRYFEDYYYENLSLSEISENLNISRNAINKTILNMKEKLFFFEEKLKLYNKNKKIRDIIELEDIDKIKKELEELIKDELY